MLKNERIFVAGHTGLVGSAICRRLEEYGVDPIVTRTHHELDLLDQSAVRDFFKAEQLDRVVLAAARVGGIYANNTYPAEFIYQNLMIEANVMHQAYEAGIQKLLFLGSSCIYPKMAPQPMKEKYLLTGPLESTNAPYAMAKIAGIQFCEAYNRQYGTQYRAVMPTNLYGPFDNFDLQTSHVLPALIRKFHLAQLVQQGDLAAVVTDEKRFGPIPEDLKTSLGITSHGSRGTEPTVPIWGTGAPYREFLHTDDMADACIYVMEMDDEVFTKGTEPHGFPFVNIGCGSDLTIRELSELIAETVGYDGKVAWDETRDDGTPRKLMDITQLNALGWSARISLKQGIRQVYDWYRSVTSDVGSIEQVKDRAPGIVKGL